MHDSSPARHWVLLAVCLSALVLPLSFSGGAVATPSIAQSPGGSADALAWVTNGFMLAFGSLLMTAGSLADRFGRKRIFGAGMALFTLASLGVAVAPGIMGIDLLRGVQGIAAAFALSGGSAALAQEFDGHERTRAFSLLGVSFGVGLAFGPLLAALLISLWGWRAMFIAIALIGAAALAFGWPRMRETRHPAAHRFDFAGAASFTAALALFTLGVIRSGDGHWAAAGTWVPLAASVLLAAAFVVIERRTAHPMLDLTLFRYPRFVGVQVLPVGTCYCYIVLVVLLPLRFIGVDDRGELGTGLLMLALSAPMFVVPPLAARLALRYAPGLLCGIGFLVAAAGLLWLAPALAHHDDASIVASLLVIGVGSGLPWGLMDGLSISVVPRERAGMATGIFSTTRVAGEGVALAISGTLFAALLRNGLRKEGLPQGRLSEEAARHLAGGDLHAAQAVLHDVPSLLLADLHAQGFTLLLHLLAGITVLSALVTFACLVRAADAPATPAGDNVPASAP